jgi:hypothetical protein
MNLIKANSIEWTERQSPKGKYKGAFLAIGGAMKAQESKHPFEILILRIPPGKRPRPYHFHGSQWEFYTSSKVRGRCGWKVRSSP